MVRLYYPLSSRTHFQRLNGTSKTRALPFPLGSLSFSATSKAGMVLWFRPGAEVLRQAKSTRLLHHPKSVGLLRQAKSEFVTDFKPSRTHFQRLNGTSKTRALPFPLGSLSFSATSKAGMVLWFRPGAEVLRQV